jgi:hypothetical protein
MQWQKINALDRYDIISSIINILYLYEHNGM